MEIFNQFSTITHLCIEVFFQIAFIAHLCWVFVTQDLQGLFHFIANLGR